MAARNVALTERQQAFIDRLVASGRYRNAGEVLDLGMRLIEEREARDAEKLTQLRQAADRGFSDLEGGRFVDVPAEELDAFIAAIGRAANTKISPADR